MPTLLVIRYRHLTQTCVSLKGYFLAQVTENRIRVVFRLGWIQFSTIVIRTLSIHWPNFSFLTWFSNRLFATWQLQASILVA